MRYDYDFSLLKAANISQRDAAEVLFGVTITTVNLWVNGRHAPTRIVARHVLTELENIRVGLSRGELPVPRHRSAQKRRVYLQEWIKNRSAAAPFTPVA